ncbi:hypothetical protein L596_006051 [Steinernema carpocapsae]|uniref:Peptidase M13 C-terminal domain-containing protein n=1 Tax=Steinernema carpocapsae TaxID=34508 RepID=A0A4U8V2D7_STECR|nr:hypothetical protein L596_006051 [Steinernema carpocapsae]
MAGLTAPKIAVSVIAVFGLLAILGISIASLVIVVNNQNNIKDLKKDAGKNGGSSTDAEGKLHFPEPPHISKSDQKKYQAYQDVVALFKQSVDLTQDPCNDFYKYTCNRFNANMGMSFDKSDSDNMLKMAQKIEENGYIKDTAPLPLRQIKTIYNVCLKTKPKKSWDQYVTKATQVFAQFKKFETKTTFTFPMLDQTSTVPQTLTSKQIATMLGFLSGTLGTDTFISTQVDTNWDDPNGAKGYAMYLDQSTQRYDNSYYRKIWDQIKDKYAQEIYNRTHILAKIQGTKLNDTTLKEDIQDILNLELLLAKNMSTADSVRRQYQPMYNPFTQVTLNSTYKSIDWPTYFSELFVFADDSVKAVINNSSYVYYLQEPQRLAQLDAALKKLTDPFKPRQIINYFYFRIMMSNKNNMPQPDAIVEEHKSVHIGRERRPHRHTKFTNSPIMKYVSNDAAATTAAPTLAPTLAPITDDDRRDCAATTMSLMQYANARVFIDKIYPKPEDRLQVRAHVGILAESILTGMQSMIDQLNWMTHITKAGAYNKINKLIKNIAYPDFVANDAELIKYYEKLTFALNETDYFKITESVNVFNSKITFAQLTAGPNNRKDFAGEPGTTNAWYQPERNSITFPAAILQQPFYDYNFPASVNFGAMGVIAGHELTHGFDDEGVQWDGTGVLSTWMDKTSNESFTKMAECVVNEYNHFCPLQDKNGPCVDGSQTQGENIADNGGIHSAYRAYKNYVNLHGADPALPDPTFGLFTQDQLFFLSFAQVWCQFPPSQKQLLAQLMTDPHSPSEQRVFGTIQNFPAFKNAFNCPAGSRYAPKDACQVWVSDIAPRNATDVSDTNIGQLQKSRSPKYENITMYFESSIDNTIDPCDDFYSYACGNYNQSIGQLHRMQVENNIRVSNVLNGNMSRYSNLTSMQKLNIYNKACLAYLDYGQKALAASGRAINDTVYGLKSTGLSFPFVDGKTTELTPKVLGSALGYLCARNIQTLVSFQVDTNWRDPHSTDAYKIYVDQSSATEDRSAYQNATLHIREGDLIANTEALLNYTANVVYKLKDDNVISQLAQDILQLEQELMTTYTADDTSRRIQMNQYNLFTIDAANKKYPFIDWWAFMKSLTQYSGLNWDDKKWSSITFGINEPDMLAKLQTAFTTNKGSFSHELISNYLFYRILNANSGYTNAGASFSQQVTDMINSKLDQYGGFVPRRKNLEEDFFANKDVTADQHNCATMAMGDLSWAHGRILIDLMYPEKNSFKEVKDGVESVIDNIVVSFRSMLDSLDWMTIPTKNSAYKKLDNLVKNIGYPDWMHNDAQLDAYYKTLKIDESMDFYKIQQKLFIFNSPSTFLPLTYHDNNRKDFSGMATALVNAYYAPEFNSINFPSGILQQPFFDKDWPAPALFGAMGMVCGHELTHGFDDQGVQWDSTGVLSTWMDDQSAVGFNNMAQCVINQYSHFCPLNATAYPGANCLNGANTQGENIADNGGLHASFRAYRNWQNINGPNLRLPGAQSGQFTNDQIFFLSFAQIWCQQDPSDKAIFNAILTDPHSPARYRIKGPLQNYPAFRQAFNCRKNKGYTPEKHCNVWVTNANNTGNTNPSRANLNQDKTIKADQPKYQAYSSGAQRIRDSMNTSFNPCDNFYKYACANMPAQTPNSFLTARNNNYAQMAAQFKRYDATPSPSNAVQKTTAFYKQCVIEKGNEAVIKGGKQIKARIEEFRTNTGGWSFSWFGEKNNNPPKFNKDSFTKLLAYLSRDLKLDTLITIGVDTNPDLGAMANDMEEPYQLMIDQNTLVNDKTYYTPKAWPVTSTAYSKDASNLIESYLQLVQSSMVNATLEQTVNKLLNFELNLARNYSGDETQRRKFRRPGTDKCSATALGLKCNNTKFAVDCINFKLLLSELAKNAGEDLQNLVKPDTYHFYILQVDKMDAFCKYIKASSDNFESAANYLFYRILDKYSSWIPQLRRRRISGHKKSLALETRKILSLSTIMTLLSRAL